METSIFAIAAEMEDVFRHLLVLWFIPGMFLETPGSFLSIHIGVLLRKPPPSSTALPQTDPSRPFTSHLNSKLFKSYWQSSMSRVIPGHYWHFRFITTHLDDGTRVSVVTVASEDIGDPCCGCIGSSSGRLVMGTKNLLLLLPKGLC